MHLPATVRAAAIILATYGLVILAKAIVDQNALGWENMDARGFPRAVLRFLGMAFIAWGLLRRAHWAWWCGVLLPSFFTVAGIVALGFFWRIRNEAPEAWSAVSSPLIVGYILALAVAVALLLLPSSRAAFRKPA